MSVSISIQKPKVFVSYSRADERFADELVAGLAYDGRFEVSIDRVSIVEGEDWKARLGALIADCDTVVFILSPQSAQSPTCTWEVEEAHRLSKRILPVLAEKLGSITPPSLLGALNYVRFDEGRSFMAGLTALTRALNTDLEWLREHTRLLARAREWDAANRQPNRMLTGPDVVEAKAWLAHRPKDAPLPTDLHLAFIKASEEAEAAKISAERERLAQISAAQTERAKALADREVAIKKLSRRTALGLGASGTLTTLSGGLAYWGVNAERRFRREEEERKRLSLAAEEDRRRRGAQRTDIEGQVVAYATSPGKPAFEGPDGSPYTLVLLTALREKTASLSSVLQFEAKRVSEKGLDQRPYFSTDLDGDIFLLDQPISRRKNALVVAVDEYQDRAYRQLAAVKDGQRWFEFLHQCGFDVKILKNPTAAECAKAINGFSMPENKRSGSLYEFPIQPAGLAPAAATYPKNNTLDLFFFAGVGFSLGGVERLAMSDCPLSRLLTASDDPSTSANLRLIASAGSIEVPLISARLRQAASASVIILDTNFVPIERTDGPIERTDR
jgi:hypothetical protein